MTIFQDFKNLSGHDIAKALGIFSSTVAPGFLILFLFRPDLISSLDVIKLIFLSLALTIPQVIFIIFSVAIAFKDPPNDHNLKTYWAFIFLWSFWILYFSLLCSYLEKYSFKNFLFLVCFINFLHLGGSAIRAISKSRKKSS